MWSGAEGEVGYSYRMHGCVSECNYSDIFNGSDEMKSEKQNVNIKFD